MVLLNLKAMAKYTITGKLRNGRRFAPIHTDTYWHYNIWQGTIWENLKDDPDGRKRKRINTVL